MEMVGKQRNKHFHPPSVIFHDTNSQRLQPPLGARDASATVKSHGRLVVPSWGGLRERKKERRRAYPLTQRLQLQRQRRSVVGAGSGGTRTRHSSMADDLQRRYMRTEGRQLSWRLYLSVPFYLKLLGGGGDNDDGTMVVGGCVELSGCTAPREP